MAKKSATKFFAETLAKIESESIRSWANDEHNRPLLIAHIEKQLAGPMKLTPCGFATWLTLVAMG